MLQILVTCNQKNIYKEVFVQINGCQFVGELTVYDISMSLYTFQYQ